MTTFTRTVEYDPINDVYYIELGNEITDAMGWDAGDTLNWEDNGDGSFSLTKKEQATEMEWVMVEAISTFRMRYMVEVPKGKAEWALDTVTMNEAEEFSQEHLGEQIVSHRVVSKEEALALCDADNDYCNTWNDEQKVKAFFTKFKE